MKRLLFFWLPVLTLSTLPQVLHAQNNNDKDKMDQEFEKTKQLIVMINVELGGAQEFGSGIIVGRKKDELLIATAYHLLHKGTTLANKVLVKFRVKPDKYLEAGILKYSNEDTMDLALLSVKDLSKEGIDVCAVPFDGLGNTSSLKRGDGVFPLGNPNGEQWSMPLVHDMVSDFPENYISFQSLFIEKGHSGGGLLDYNNAGITGMIVADKPPFGRAINIDSIISKVKLWGYPVQLRIKDYRGQTPLHIAAEKGDITAIKNLLSDCNNVNQRDDHQATPLHFAAYSSTEALKLLIKYGADLNLLDADGDPPLEWADEKRNLENFRLLVNAGAQWRRLSPLILSGIKGDITTLKSLLKDKENINQKDDHQATPLHYFAAYATKEAVNLLIKAGADMKARDEDGELPIGWSAESGRIDIIQLLHAVEIEGNITSTRYIASAAVKKGQIEVVKYLFAIDQGLKEQRGNYLMVLAIENKQIEMLKFLLSSGGDWEYGPASTEVSPLISAVKTGQIEAIKILIEDEADIINSPGIGYPERTFDYPLRLLFQQNWEPNFMLEVLKALVSAPLGKSKKVIDSPWSYVGEIFRKNFSEDFTIEALKILIPAIEDINESYYLDGAGYQQETLLSLALENGYNMAARFLREHGAKK